MNTQEKDWCYLACLLDCQGYIGISPKFQLVIAVSAPSKQPLNSIAEVFGGTLTYQAKMVRPSERYRDGQWYWTIGADEGIKALEGAYGYMRVKQAQAFLGIAFYRNKGRYSGKAVPVGELEYRQIMYEEMKSLNQPMKKEPEDEVTDIVHVVDAMFDLPPEV